METRTLAGTELEVSRLCFGTMTFGKPVDQVGATKMVDRCLEAGVNFFDTANVYQQGVSEQMWNLLARGLEQEFVPFAKQAGVSIIAYNPLAGGLLSGKYVTQTSYTAGTRFDGNKMYQDRYWHEQNFAAVEQLKHIAAEA